MRVFTIDVRSSSTLRELTESLMVVSSQAYEHKPESVVIVVRCEHVIDSGYGEEGVQLVASWEKVLRQLEMAHALIIFISDADVFGHSFDLLLISDFRVVRCNSRLGFSLHDGAALPRMSLYRLVNQVGQAHARRVGLVGITLGADEAYQLGLVDEISESEVDVLDRALAKFGDAPTSELAIRRRLILEAQALEYDNALGAYLAACARNRIRTST